MIASRIRVVLAIAFFVRLVGGLWLVESDDVPARATEDSAAAGDGAIGARPDAAERFTEVETSERDRKVDADPESESQAAAKPVEPPADRGAFAAALADVRHALSDPAHYEQLPKSMAALLAAAAVDTVGERALLELAANQGEDELVRSVAALVYGAIAQESEAVPGALASLDPKSTVYRLLLLGTRRRAPVQFDIRAQDDWANLFSGTIQFAARSGMLPRIGAALGRDLARSRRRESPAGEAFSSSRYRRAWPDHVLKDFERRVRQPTELDLQTRLWVARELLPGGNVSPVERAVASRWFLAEPDDIVRRSMLLSTLRTSAGGETARFTVRLAELVDKGDRDAGSALRTWMSLDRDAAYNACRKRFGQWTVAVRGTAVSELLLRWPARTWDDFSDRLAEEDAPTVLKKILAGTAREKFKGGREAHLRFGDRHHAFIRGLREKPSTRKLAEAWLEYLGTR